jgi:hypothetical protein
MRTIHVIAAIATILSCASVEAQTYKSRAKLAPIRTGSAEAPSVPTKSTCTLTDRTWNKSSSAVLVKSWSGVSGTAEAKALCESVVTPGTGAMCLLDTSGNAYAITNGVLGLGESLGYRAGNCT